MDQSIWRDMHSARVMITDYVVDEPALATPNLLTPWSRVLFENLIGLQLVKKFPAFYGTRRVITPFTSARHLSLS